MRIFLGLAGVLAGCAGGHRYPDGSGLEGQLERELVALNQEVRLLRAGCDGTARIALYSELHQIFSGSEVTVERSGTTVVVHVPSRVLFSGDGETIREEATRVLDLLSLALQEHKEYKIQIVGHTADTMMTAAQTRAWRDLVGWSFHQAHIVERVLYERFGVDEARFEVVGNGPHQPLADNDTESGRNQNERIELRLIRLPFAPPPAP